MSVDRSELRFRAPVSMKLSDGSPSSKTAPPNAELSDLSPTEIVLRRFAIKGNAVVTGGAGDIGSASCRALLQHGLQGLAIFDLHEDIGQALVTKLVEEFPNRAISFFKVDVTNHGDVSKAVKLAEENIGPITTCLCFAGIAFSMNALEIPPEKWQKMFDVNTTGAFLVAQATAKCMVERGSRGSIILMASISAHIVNYPQPQVHYNAAKAAIISIKSSLAAEWARYGIRVNSISPGYMNTILNEGEGLAIYRKIWAERTPFGRMGEPDELSGAVILLASEAGSYITGADILVDGGISVF